MGLAVVFLPDTVLLVSGAAGRTDPGVGLRAAALAAVRVAEAEGTILVVAPGRRDRDLPHPVATGLGAAGLPENGPSTASPRTDVATPGRADVAASVALVLLREAGVDSPVSVLELARPSAGVGLDSEALRALGRDRVAGVTLLVAVGSLSARHGPDAPVADDPRAAVVDARLIAALADGPDALAGTLAELGAVGAGELAVSGWAPWQVALGALGLDAPRIRATEPEPSALPGASAIPGTSAMPTQPGPSVWPALSEGHAVSAEPTTPAVSPAPVVAEVIAGAQHAVATWLPAPTPASEESR